MTSAMSEERRDQVQEEARHVLSPVRLAVLLLLGAFFVVVGGSRADAAGAEPAPDERRGLVSTPLGALDAGPLLTGVGTTVDGVVEPVLAAAGPVVQPVVEPVVRPVAEPVVTPLRPVVDRVAPPVAGLPLSELVDPAPAPTPAPERAATPVRTATAGTAEAAEATTAAATGTDPAAAAAVAAVVDAPTDPAAPASGTPVSRSAASTTDGGTSTPVPHAVLLTAFVAVLLFAGGVAPRRVAAPLAPTFLPPVFPG